MDCSKTSTIFVPYFAFQHNLNYALQSVVYCLCLVFCFIGVAIISNTFVDGITEITSATKKVLITKKDGESEKFIRVKIWNDTVANLTLMALGSSAPEIFLAMFEIIKSNFEGGDLGPESIVGSAGFNLLIINAVCIVSIPKGDGRRLQMFHVFLLSSCFSFFAYIWLLLVLEFSSPDVIELWEALLTFMFFPVFILAAWATDKYSHGLQKEATPSLINLCPKDLPTAIFGEDDSFKSRITAAVTVNNPTKFECVVHVASVIWKITFAFIPSPKWKGGWPCFVTCLLTIGFLTAIIEDLATFFGCFAGLKDAVTAITFVAVGTSFPDMFVSRAAAMRDSSADNAVGNINGSNCINVFVGLGLPWLIAAIHHELHGTVFYIQEGTLPFSDMLYTLVALLAMILMTLRRKLNLFGKVELGGPTAAKWCSAFFLFCLWIFYVVLASLGATEVIKFNF